MDKLRAHKVYILILSLVVILTGSSVFAMLNGSEPDHGENPIGDLDVMRSQVLVTGNGYDLNIDQEKKRKEEEKKKEEKQEEEKKQNRTSEANTKKAWAKAAPGSGSEKSGRNKDKGKNSNKKGTASKGGNQNVTPGPNDPNGPQDPEGSDDPGIDESKLPTIDTDLMDGETYGGSYLGFYVTAKDYKSNRISRQFFVVYANDKRIYSSGTDDDKGNYDFDLRDGENTVRITVTDKEGNSLTRSYTVNGDTGIENEENGIVDISLSARNINLGYLAGPKTMTIYRNEKLSYVITRFLRENGFGYDYTGSLSSGFYLQRIKKPGMLSGWSIPDDIQELLDDKGVSSMGWDEDSLGEKDIYEGSGWMYSYNGEVVDSGFSSIVVKDGDDVEIWFTTHLGDDR